MAIADHQEWFYLSPFNLSTKQINNQSKYKLYYFFKNSILQHKKPGKPLINSNIQLNPNYFSVHKKRIK